MINALEIEKNENKRSLLKILAPEKASQYGYGYGQYPDYYNYNRYGYRYTTQPSIIDAIFPTKDPYYSYYNGYYNDPYYYYTTVGFPFNLFTTERPLPPSPFPLNLIPTTPRPQPFPLNILFPTTAAPFPFNLLYGKKK